MPETSLTNTGLAASAASAVANAIPYEALPLQLTFETFDQRVEVIIPIDAQARRAFIRICGSNFGTATLLSAMPFLPDLKTHFIRHQPFPWVEFMIVFAVSEAIFLFVFLVYGWSKAKTMRTVSIVVASDELAIVDRISGKRTPWPLKIVRGVQAKRYGKTMWARLVISTTRKKVAVGFGRFEEMERAAEALSNALEINHQS